MFVSYMFVCLYGTCLFVCLLVCLFICLFNCLFVSSMSGCYPSFNAVGLAHIQTGAVLVWPVHVYLEMRGCILSSVVCIHINFTLPVPYHAVQPMPLMGTSDEPTKWLMGTMTLVPRLRHNPVHS